ncbi:hypothetical protein LTR91_006642 [Friedmanniomyces endolithicus]|uniref:Uncharacterized protein n=1 Tax=Friedmanniomyces endolithicus TaxID=329885 RepID=A0AAN6QWE1_9PEZI|nr:hypothetical protein LTR57_002745 [Friedmanniomyces endolithicus]KAK0966480.1 hypothetical protein LTS01_017755 [Friedmanniomyces endolithicus]KAK0997675.1 hypothetical protein LTR91_006642 [Friedmanniomyces endolithicus]KAK1053110.1 hypothetical protein LTS16_001533 [Friedmanniomyces endolithicus]
MRDRRNTILSVSSLSTTGSTHSGRSSLSEKFGPSPPDSPTLPSPVTRDNRRRRRYSRLTLIKLLAGIATLFLLLRVFLCRPQTVIEPYDTGRSLDEGLAISGAQLDSPGSAVVRDDSGHSKWTVLIPENSTFPLNDIQYANICSEGEVLREKLVRNSRVGRLLNLTRRMGYYSRDWTYLDPSAFGVTGASPPVVLNGGLNKVCSTSLTFVLDANEASFGKSMLMLWLSYGLAKHEGRAFFIDDTQWAYGKYASYFATPPDQGCAPPPKHHIVPCPHQARHLLVTTGTAQWTFGTLFDREFAARDTGPGTKYKHVFDMVRRGYEDLFALIGVDAAYAQTRIAELHSEASAHANPVVAMHIRRGDLHPHEQQYSGDYLPLERYVAGARSLLRSLRSKRKSDITDDHYGSTLDIDHTQSSLLLASDDPDILTSSSLAHATSPLTVQPAQERIQLATKATLDRTSPVAPLREPGSAYVKHVDENSGWEGGFFSALFYSLGITQASTLKRLSQLPGSVGARSEQAMRMRELVGRAYLLDLAVLGESDGVVCAVSSAACRVLGVMMGWEAVRDGRWMNVDDGRPWCWDGSG